MTHLTLGQSPLTLAQLRGVLDGPCTVDLTPAAWTAVDRGAAVIAAIVAEGRTVYGVNTGFGLLANTSIATDDLETLQKNLVLSHACGVGALLDDRVTRLLMVLKIASLSKGASGIRRESDAFGGVIMGLDRVPQCDPVKEGRARSPHLFLGSLITLHPVWLHSGQKPR